MTPPPFPPDETERLASLRALGLLDTPAEERFDRITRLAQTLFDVPIALISLVDADRQWFKSRQGLGAEQTSRDVSFCGHAILGSEIFEVSDATRDPRFRDNPLVLAIPDIRFYAGAPLSGPGGHKIGTLCLIDRKPRELTTQQKQILKDLAALVEREIAASVPGAVPVLTASAKGAAIDQLFRLGGAMGWKVLAGFGFAAATVLVLGAASYRSARGFVETSRWVTQTHEVLQTLKGVSTQAKDELSDERGFVITGDELFSRRYREASRGMADRVAELRRLTAGNPDQLRRLDGVDRLAARYENLAERVMAQRRTRGLNAAAGIIAAGEPQRAIEALDAAIAEMENAERLLLSERSARADAEARWLILLMSCGSIGGALIVLLAFWAVRHDIDARARAESELVRAHDAALQDADARRQAQAEAERLSGRLRAVLDNMDSGVIMIGTNLSISVFNPAAERIHGAWRDEIERLLRAGSHPPRLPDEKTPLSPDEDPLPRALKGETVHDARLFMKTPFRPNGYFISVSAAPVRSHQGLVTGAVLLFRDITDSVRSERRQNLQYEAIRILAETRIGGNPMSGLLRTIGERLGWAYAGFWTPDMSGLALRSSGQWSAVPGAALDEFARASAESRFERGVGLPGRAWKERRAIWIKDVTEAQNFPRIEEAEAAGLRGALAFPVLVGERCLGVIEVLSAGVPEPDDEMLKLVAALGAQIGLFLDGRRAEEERTRFFNLSLDMLCVAGFDGYFKVLNEGWEKTLGWTKEELMAKPYMVFVHPDDRQITLSEAGKIAESTKTLQFDNRYLCKDGSYKWLSWTSTPVQSEGLLYAAARDVTERRRVTEELAVARDAALSAAKFKSDFLANMSHEIRTPMNAIIGMTGLLLDTPLSASQRDYLETVRGAGDALLTLINDILDYSKIEAGKMRLESGDFDLRETVERAVELVAQPAQQKGLEVTVSIAPGVPSVLRGDAGRLRQVLLNILGNAVKFTEKGEISVTAEYQPAGDRALITLSVRDTGIGIPPDSQSDLFQSFIQVDASTTRKYGGTGLGLAISRELVELMGGRIGVESEPGRGSRFWFEIPFSVGVEGPAAPRREPAELTSVRAIVVDDNATNREIVRVQLAAWKIVCDAARGAQEGLEMMRRAARDGRPYGLAILDLQMPDVDGLSLSATIKDTPLLGHPPVILMTSLGNVMNPAAMKASGLAASLTKPVRQSTLYDAVMTALDQRGKTASTAAATAPSPRGAHLRVLVVEDNSVNQKVILLQLQKLGYTADAVASGLEALESLQKIGYDLVLMDCQMPEMDGYEATLEIRRREAAAGSRRTPVIALTANVMPEDRQRCFEAGMDDYLSKPVRLEELARVISARASSTLKWETVRDLRDMAGEEGFKHIREEFFRCTERSLSEMRDAVKGDDRPALVRAAHTLKGSSGSFGAAGLETMCREIEKALTAAASRSDLQGLIERMTGEFAAVKRDMESA